MLEQIFRQLYLPITMDNNFKPFEILNNDLRLNSSCLSDEEINNSVKLEVNPLESANRKTKMQKTDKQLGSLLTRKFLQRLSRR